jgi:2-keto-4-pentenoate hydratase
VAQSRISQAAAFLLEEHAELRRFSGLPSVCAPASTDEAYAMQDAFVALKASRHGRPVGWKIALTTPKMQQLVGLSTSIAGALHEGQVVKAPARISAAGYARLIVEFEIAAEMGADLPARKGPYCAADVSPAIAALMPAFELADDRNADYSTLAAHGLNMIADNAWNEGAVLGEPVRNWQHVDLPALRGVALINGEVVGEGSGADAMGSPLNVVAWIANNLAARGKALRKGDIVITGSLVTSKFPAAGDRIRFQAGELGSIELSVA